MLGPLDPFDFFLALQLGFHSVEEMNDTLTNQQYVKWMSYFKWKAAMEEYEMKKGRR